jgi:hypothetical protein
LKNRHRNCKKIKEISVLVDRLNRGINLDCPENNSPEELYSIATAGQTVAEANWQQTGREVMAQL